MIVLVGFMGAGKSTVGRMLAERLGVEFFDADDAIEERAGLAVADIFSSRGESEFRALERQTVGELLSGGEGVIALGGGALGDSQTRLALESEGKATVVYLEVDHAVALRRIEGDAGRPLLAAPDVAGLHERRRETYESAAAIRINTTEKTPEEVVEAILDNVGPAPHEQRPIHRVGVPVAHRPYEVIVGAGVAERIGAFAPGVEGAEKAFLVTHPELIELAEPIAASLQAAGLRTLAIDIPSGESSKSLDVVANIYDRLGKEAAHRRDLVVGVGGGVVTDIAGFVASTFNRGMPVVHVPTSLLGQVDAAIGGKTGINLDHGKNLVGTFHQPSLVVCDVKLLATLPYEEMRSGMAEVIKYGFISAPELLALVAGDPQRILVADPGLLIEVVARSVEIKAAIVAADEREEGRRALLNYGHTFAHAIEHIAGYGSIRHGEAVAVGMMAAAHLGHALGRFDESVVEAHRRVLGAVGLPAAASLDIDALEHAWLRDKKYLHGVRFVLLKAIGAAESGVTAPRQVIVKALERLSK